KEHAATLADVASRKQADRLATVALRCPQNAHVVHAGCKDSAERDPQKCWEPAPNHRDCWADNGRGTRHGSEVVSPQNVFISGDKVHAVFHGVGGSFVVGGKLENFFAKKF